MTILENGEAYVGEFRFGQETGYGYCNRTYEQYEYSPKLFTSAIYEGGLFFNQKPIPYGLFCGGQQPGQYRSGYGVINTHEDQKYEGSWLNGEKHGQGTFTDQFGSTYVGEWEDNVKGSNDQNDEPKNGYGVSIELNGDKDPLDSNNGTYEGEWFRNLRNGKGKFTYSDGTIYNGYWEAGRKSGQGTLTLPNKDKFEGKWTFNYPVIDE